MKSNLKKVGILGAGKVGVVLAQLSLKAGYDVYIAGSGNPAKIALSIKVLAPGGHAVTKEEAAQQGDVIILAAPLSKYKNLPVEELSEKLVIDSMNHWYEVDGPREDTIANEMSSSEAIQNYLKPARVVKALSHMGYHELFDNPKPTGATNRKAIAIAANSKNDATIVGDFIDSLGFDPLYIGALSEGRKLEPGTPVFGANTTKELLRSML